MLEPLSSALVLAPMEGITDAPMRRLQLETGAFTYAVSEFIRVSQEAIPTKVFKRDVPELAMPGKPSVQVQILGGDPELMAESARNAVAAGATAVDINFGCPAKTVNRHDGGASLLKYPTRIREIVTEIRKAVPITIPVSAKLRLGWDTTDAIYENAAMAAEGGASWLTIHARTRVQGYQPPVFWRTIGEVRTNLSLPIIANGDIWTFEDFLCCRDQTGCNHFMIGRGALANPRLPYQIARSLGLIDAEIPAIDWLMLFNRLRELTTSDRDCDRLVLMRLKQWMKLAHKHGDFPWFHELKTLTSLEEFMSVLAAQRNLSGLSSSCGTNVSSLTH